MRAVLLPAIMKPHSAISSWLIPMVYVRDDEREYICDNCDPLLVVKAEVPAYEKYNVMTMRVDALNRPINEKVSVDLSSAVSVPIDAAIEMIAPKAIAKVDGEYDTYRDYSRLVKTVFDALDVDVRAVIAIPTQWVVYDAKAKLLTRLAFVRQLSITEVRALGKKNILIVAEATDLERLNSLSVSQLKRARLAKERMNQAWRMLVAKQKLEEIQEMMKEVEKMAPAAEGGAEVEVER